jgi:RNA-directed DNA polymerase
VERLRASETVSTQLERIAIKAKEDREVRFTSLAHLLTPELLRASFLQLNRHAAPGIDGVEMETFRANLDAEVEALWLELRTGRYQASPVRRVYIPKANGKLRPLGVPTVRDRTVQRAVAAILGAVYEPYFCDCSWGFRPKRSAHDALESLRRTIDRTPIGWVVEADIESYFDTVNHRWLRAFLAHRIADPVLLRLIGKWLRAGIMEGGVVSVNEDGTPQGGPLSPLLANIYLHYVLDLWFERRIQPRLAGHAALVRYADDFVVCFERRDEALAFRSLLAERLGEFGLRLSAAKTREIEFGKEAGHNGEKGPGEGPRSFDFLGFTHYMRLRPKRGYRLARKPSRDRRNRFLARIKAWIIEHRHHSPWLQAKILRRKLMGYFAYFGLRHCLPALRHVKWHVERLWITALRNRSQRHQLFWSKNVQLPWFRLLPEPTLR